jgi:hypothetical protein
LDDIYKCKNKYFRVLRTTHTAHQPQSDQTVYGKTADVVVMGFSCSDERWSEYLTLDSPKTPKILIADAESSESKPVIASKVDSLTTQLLAYSVNGRDVLGLLVSGSMQVTALFASKGRVERYKELDGIDLTRVSSVVHTMKCLNAYLHKAANEEMTEELRQTLPITRSRSASVVTTSSGLPPRFSPAYLTGLSSSHGNMEL